MPSPCIVTEEFATSLLPDSSPVWLLAEVFHSHAPRSSEGVVDFSCEDASFDAWDAAIEEMESFCADLPIDQLRQLARDLNVVGMAVRNWAFRGMCTLVYGTDAESALSEFTAWMLVRTKTEWQEIIEDADAYFTGVAATGVAGGGLWGTLLEVMDEQGCDDVRLSAIDETDPAGSGEEFTRRPDLHFPRFAKISIAAGCWSIDGASEPDDDDEDEDEDLGSFVWRAKKR